ncbi:MAG: recombinase family protein [Clostridia bacterium]|nr:recombinase family protein [Clostridia bacterium]
MKAAIYCRLSEEDRNKQAETDDSNSIQNQKVMLSQYAREQGWEIYRIYSDDDYTGSDRRRPEFNALLDDAKKRKFDIVLCKTQSRFTRELELVEKYIHGLFPLLGIRFVSIVDNADTANKGNKKSRQINGLVNEWYLEDMSDNIKSVLTNRRVNGFHIGAFALYGYLKDPDQKGHLLIDEEAAAVVREVFTLFSQGYGKTAIARMLNDRGIPNPTEYKRLKGLRYQNPKTPQSTLWKYFAISDMLVNEIYIGNMVQGKYGSVSYKTKQNRPRPREEWYIVENTHEPIIERELWDKVQQMISERAKPFSDGTIGLFARKARCANCGYIMRSGRGTKESGGRRYLQCPNHHVSKDACEGAFISVDRLEHSIIAELNKLATEYLEQDEVLQNIQFCDTLKEQRKQIQEDNEIYTKKITEYTKGIRELYMDKVRGIITEADYLEMTKEFSKDKGRLEHLIMENEKKLSDIENRIASGDNRRDLVEQYMNLEHLTREMVEILIDYISVGKRIPHTRDVPIEIHWNF